jgi:hypothetical protein
MTQILKNQLLFKMITQEKKFEIVKYLPERYRFYVIVERDLLKTQDYWDWMETKKQEVLTVNFVKIV